MDQEITALKVQKRNPNRVNVYLDGAFAFGLSRITAAWLQIGQILTAEKIRELQTADDFEVGYQQAVNYLSYRTRSEREVRDNLRKHNFSDEVIQAVLEKLSRLGLVDDRQFAQMWVENRNEFRPRGRRALQMELRQKGIEDSIIAEVLAELDEDELAYQAAVKQARKYAGLPWEGFRQKMVAFLARRGFHYGVAIPIVERVWSEYRSPLQTEE
jgi:regulatory protein